MSAKKIADLVIKSRFINPKTEKNKYINVGVRWEKDGGGVFITINKGDMLKALFESEDKESVILSEFKPKETAPTANNKDDNIPF